MAEPRARRECSHVHCHGDLIVAGYGFTREPDFLYLLDRRTGKALDRPEVIKLRRAHLHVRTYDHDLVVRIAGTG